MTFTECLAAVAVSDHPEYFPALYADMVESGSIDSTALLDADYIRSADLRYKLFDHSLDRVIEAARLIKSDAALVRYTNLLSAALLDRARFFAHDMPTLPPVAPDTPSRNFVGLIAMLPAMEIADRFLQRHSFEESDIRRNFATFESFVDSHEHRYGFAALDQRYFEWVQHYIDVTIVRYGGFNFEIVRSFEEDVVVLKNTATGETVRVIVDTDMHRDGMVLGSIDFEDEDGSYFAEFIETDDYFEGYTCGDDGFCTGVKRRFARPEWEIGLRSGDAVVNVHIPGSADLSGRVFTDAANGVLELFRDYYPDIVPKAVCCISWLMDKRIDAVCGGAPKISNFQSAFGMFPIESDGSEVTRNVFTKPFKSLDELPEDTRLMRGLKKLYLEGKHLHEFGGVFLVE